MRALLLSCALVLAVPAAAQPAKMLKVDVIAKSDFGHRHMDKGEKATKSSDSPTEVHARMPLSLIKGFLGAVNEKEEVKINGKGKKGVKIDEIIKLIENAKSGDLILEVTTDKGDLVKISVE